MTSGKGRPSLARAASGPLASGAVGYQTAVGRVRSDAPGKLPFGMVGRVVSTSVSEVSPTPYGPESSKRVPARVSRTSVIGGRRVSFGPTTPQPGSDALGARGQTSSVGLSSAVPSTAAWSRDALNAQSGTLPGFAPHVMSR